MIFKKCCAKIPSSYYTTSERDCIYISLTNGISSDYVFPLLSARSGGRHETNSSFSSDCYTLRRTRQNLFASCLSLEADVRIITLGGLSAAKDIYCHRASPRDKRDECFRARFVLYTCEVAEFSENMDSAIFEAEGSGNSVMVRCWK